MSLKSTESTRSKMLWMLKCYENFEPWSNDAICRSVILFNKNKSLRVCWIQNNTKITKGKITINRLMHMDFFPILDTFL